MAQMKNKGNYKTGSVQRVSSLKPGLRGARAWSASKVRAAGHSRKSFLQFSGGVASVFVVLTILALWLGGFWPTILQNAKLFKQNRLMDMGFVVAQVDVMGEGRLDEAEVRRAVNIRPGDYFFGVDLEEAQRRTESLPWVDRAVVRRLWPDRIVVQLIENQPYALWQNEGALSLVSAEGKVIAPVHETSHVPQGVLHIVGKGAAENAQALEATLKAWPGLRQRVSSAVYVSEQRWDLILDKQVKVKLPALNYEKAVAQLALLQSKTQLLDRQISEIDLRLSDRISLRPAPTTQA